MSASPGDAQPVFDLIARRAAKLCDVPVAAVARLEDGLLHLVTQSGFAPNYTETYARQFPRPVGHDSTMGRAILSRRVEQIEDISADPAYAISSEPGPWSVLAVPLLRNGEALGVIGVARRITGAFSANQIAL
jgi:GAF domain-containing protein